MLLRWGWLSRLSGRQTLMQAQVLLQRRLPRLGGPLALREVLQQSLAFRGVYHGSMEVEPRRRGLALRRLPLQREGKRQIRWGARCRSRGHGHRSNCDGVEAGLAADSDDADIHIQADWRHQPVGESGARGCNTSKAPALARRGEATARGGASVQAASRGGAAARAAAAATASRAAAVHAGSAAAASSAHGGYGADGLLPAQWHHDKVGHGSSGGGSHRSITLSVQGWRHPLAVQAASPRGGHCRYAAGAGIKRLGPEQRRRGEQPASGGRWPRRAAAGMA